MGIEYEDMRSILRAVKGLSAKNRLLVLGDAAIHFSVDDYKNLSREEGYQLEDSFPQALAQNIARTFAEPLAKPIAEFLDCYSLGKSLGFEQTDTLDINGKTSLTLDLSEGLPSSLNEKFDCVIDAGVLFWNFDPAAALKNIFRMTKVGGLIIHITAVSGHYGRGFYNIHPLALERFYLGNGGQFLFSALRSKFRNMGLGGFLRRLLRFKNKVTYHFKPGYVFLGQAKLNRVAFTQSYSGLESNMLPNNVVGLFVFSKTVGGDPKAPLLMS